MKAVLLFSVLSFSAFAFQLPSHCSYDKECLIEVPGMYCADGTKSYVTLTARKNAENLLVYLSGGGACWSRVSCGLKFARPLTRVEPSTDWTNGTGIFDSHDSTNPFKEDYHVVTVPYCTGDVYAGNRVTDYGDGVFPYVIEHRGYVNVVRAIERAQQVFPAPKKVVLLGQSAGAIGTYVHMRTLDKQFQKSKKYVISDAGMPFRPPHLLQSTYDYLMKVWGTAMILPTEGPFIPKDFGEVIKYNRERFPDIRFGLISSYGDSIMSFFAYSLGAPSAKTTVRATLIDVANNHIGNNATNAKVFYIDGTSHTSLGKKLSSVRSLNVGLDEWVGAMLSDGEAKGWNNIRPDLKGPVQGADEALIPKSIDELHRWQDLN